MTESHFKKKLIPVMASISAFVFFSFALVSVYAWFYADPTLRLMRIETLRGLLVGGEPAAPAADLAGRVVHVRGVAAAAQPLADSGIGVTIPQALTAQRVTERFRISRNASWNLEEIKYLSAPGAKLNGWTLTDPLFAMATAILQPTRPGQDYSLPLGLSLSSQDPFAAYLIRGGQVVEDASAKPFATGDLRYSYRVLPQGPLSVIALADKSGAGLVPVPVDGDHSIALLAAGDVSAARMLDDAAQEAGAERLQSTLLALAAGWLVFIIPALWAPLRRWAAVGAAPLAGALVCLGAVMAAVPAGGIGGGFLAGQLAAFCYAGAIFALAWRRDDPAASR